MYQIIYRNWLGISTGGEGEKPLVRLLGDELIKLYLEPIHSCQQRWKIYCEVQLLFSCNQFFLIRCSDLLPLCSSKHSTEIYDEQNLLFWQTSLITLKKTLKNETILHLVIFQTWNIYLHIIFLHFYNLGRWVCDMKSKYCPAIAPSNIWPCASLEMGNSKLGTSHQIRHKICGHIILFGLKFY